MKWMGLGSIYMLVSGEIKLGVRKRGTRNLTSGLMLPTLLVQLREVNIFSAIFASRELF